MRLWIAVDVDLPSNPKVHQFAADLGVSVEAAMGLLVALWGQVARHRPEGDIGDVPDGLLERWCGWSGAPGRFATVYRGGFQTPDGKINDWYDHQGWLLERRRKDRERKRQGTSVETPQTIPGASEAPGVGCGIGTVVVTQTNSSTPGVGKVDTPPHLAATLRLTGELNIGMSENPGVVGFNPVVAAGQQQVVRDWLDAGIPVDLAATVVRRMARSYKPKGRGRQISSLQYCDAAVRQAWADQQERGVVPHPSLKRVDSL